MANFFLQTFQNYQIFLPHPSERRKVAPTNRNSQSFPLHTSKTFSNVELFSIFSHIFLELIFGHQNKNNVVETISCFVYQLSNKYCVYYVSEHLKSPSNQRRNEVTKHWRNVKETANITKNGFLSLSDFFCFVYLCFVNLRYFCRIIEWF